METPHHDSGPAPSQWPLHGSRAFVWNALCGETCVTTLHSVAYPSEMQVGGWDLEIANATRWEQHGNMGTLWRSKVKQDPFLIFNLHFSMPALWDLVIFGECGLAESPGPQHNPVYPAIVKLLGSFDSLGFSSGISGKMAPSKVGFWMLLVWFQHQGVGTFKKKMGVPHPLCPMPHFKWVHVELGWFWVDL